MSLANQSNERLGQLVSIAARIESHLSGGSTSNKKGSKPGPSNNGSNSISRKDAAVVGGLSNSLSNLIVNVNNIDPNAGDKLSMFIIKMSTSVKEAINTGLNQSDVETLNKNLGQLINSASGFMKSLAKSVIYAVPAFIGAKLFGLSIQILTSTLKNIPALTKDARETIKTINNIAKNALTYGLAMSAYSLIGVLALTGSVFFGLAVSVTFRVLQTLNKVKIEDEVIENIAAISLVAVLFGGAMAIIGSMAGNIGKGTTIFVVAASATLLIFKLIGSFRKDADVGSKALSEIAAGAVLFSVAMIGIGFFSQQFAQGTLVFILAATATLLIFKLFGSSKKITKDGDDSLAQLAAGAVLFALAMIGIGFFAQQFAVGTLTFILAASATLLVFRAISVDKSADLGAAALARLGGGAFLFAIGMIAIGYFAQQFAIGTLTFILAATATLFVFGVLSKRYIDIERGANAMNTIARSVIPFTLAMLVAGFFPAKVLIGATVLSGAMLLVGGITILLGKGKENLEKGAAAIGKLSLAAIGFSAALFILGKIPEDPLTLALKVAVLAGAITVLGIAAVVLGKKSEDVSKGAGVLMLLGISLGVFAVALHILARIPGDTKTLGEKLTMVGFSVIGLAMAAIVLGEEAVMVAQGAGVLMLLGISLAIFAGSLYILGSIPGETKTLWEKLGMVGASVVVLGLAAAALGSVAPMAAAGAAVLLMLGSSLAIFAAAMYILSKSDLKRDSVDIFVYAVKQIGDTLAGMALLAIPMGIGSAGLIAASLSIYALSGGLREFKTVDFKKEDGDLIGTAISSVVKGFAGAFGELGFDDVLKAMAAIPLITDMGNALVSLASGVKAMATLSFTEMEYDKKAGKLIPKGVVKLTDAEIKKVGPNVAKIISSLTKPLADFGRAMHEGTASFGAFSFGAGNIEKAIEAAAGIGNIISSLARGVADMANLNVVEYTVAGKGVNAKLVPKSVRKLTGTVDAETGKAIDGDFKAAADNVSSILLALTQPLIDFGRKISSEGTVKFGGFSLGSGDIEKAIEAAAGIGNIISSLAKGVADMANLTVVEYKVAGKGVNAKLVPTGTPRKLRGEVKDSKVTGDFKAAGENVGAILMALTQPLTDFGKAMAGGESKFLGFTFGAGDIEKGIEGIAKIGDPISKLADTVIKMAGGQIQVYEAKKGKMVLKEVLSFKDAIPKAVANAKLLLMGDKEGKGSLIGVLVKFADYMKSNEEKFNAAADFIPKFETTVGSLAKVSTDYAAIFENLNKTTKSKVDPAAIFTKLATSLITIGNSFSTMGKDKLTLYSDFVTTTTKLTNIITPFEKFTKLFGTFTKDLGSFVKTWNSFGTEDTNNFKTYADSLDKISKIDVSKLKETTQIIKEQTLKQKEVSFKNNNNFTKANQNQSSSDAAVVSNLMRGQNMNNNESSTKPTPAEERKSSGLGVKPGTVIAELHVTNLYINNKLQ